LAKVVSTLDVVSGGRAILGVGAGWSQAEFEGFSEWSEPRIRVDKTREGVELILRLWKEKKVDFDGKYYRSRKAILEPKPIQKPHPPLLFAGFGPRMLRLAGRYADICLIPPVGWTELTRHNMRSIVEQEAVRLSRADKISFASALLQKASAGERYEAKEYEIEVQRANEQRDEYFFVAFPERKYVESMRSFSKDIIPSYAN